MHTIKLEDADTFKKKKLLQKNIFKSLAEENKLIVNRKNQQKQQEIEEDRKIAEYSKLKDVSLVNFIHAMAHADPLTLFTFASYQPIKCL